MTSSKKYAELKNLGLCTKCGKSIENSPSTVRCLDCYNKFTTKRKELKTQRAEQNLCIQCGGISAAKYCGTCKQHNADLKKQTTSQTTLVKYDETNQNCKICNGQINTLGCLCQTCFSNTVFTRQDAVRRYGNCCPQCLNTEINDLRIVSSDINKPMKKHGPDLYKLVCFSIKKLDEYSILCHKCYRENCIAYVKTAKQFFMQMSPQETSGSTDDLEP